MPAAGSVKVPLSEIIADIGFLIQGQHLFTARAIVVISQVGFSACGRDLGGTIEEARKVAASKLPLLHKYWNGRELRKSKQRATARLALYPFHCC